MLPQIFNFFNRLLETASVRAKFYFNVDGAVYPEQIGIYGLCPTCDHGWGNTTGLPVPQIKYHFSTALEVGLMLTEYAAYTDKDIAEYIGFLDGIVKFYDGFYPLNDPHGKMIIEPGNALETYHPVRNPIDAVAGLQSLLERMLALPDRYGVPNQRANWRRILERVPPITLNVYHRSPHVRKTAKRSLRMPKAHRSAITSKSPNCIRSFHLVSTASVNLIYTASVNLIYRLLSIRHV